MPPKRSPDHGDSPDLGFAPAEATRGDTGVQGVDAPLWNYHCIHLLETIGIHAMVPFGPDIVVGYIGLHRRASRRPAGQATTRAFAAISVDAAARSAR